MTNAEIVPRGALALDTAAEAWNAEQRTALLAMTGLEDVPEAELQVFLHVCQKTGLDPFQRQIYLIGRESSFKLANGQWSPTKKVKYTIQTGIDGFRIIANRTHSFAGVEGPFWCGPDGIWHDVWLGKGAPKAAKVGIHRTGFAAVTWGIAHWEEYDGKNKMWEKMPAGQLAKCAEAIAFRRAFPNDLSGVYATEEMDQAAEREASSPRPSGPVGQHSHTPADPANKPARISDPKLLPPPPPLDADGKIPLDIMDGIEEADGKNDTAALLDLYELVKGLGDRRWMSYLAAYGTAVKNRIEDEKVAEAAAQAARDAQDEAAGVVEAAPEADSVGA